MMSLGDIVAVNEEAMRKSRRARVKPRLWTTADVDAASELVDLPRIPYIGRRALRNYRLVAELFVDKTGTGLAGERALTQPAALRRVRELTGQSADGELYWGVVEDGPFQAYIGAWRRLDAGEGLRG
jgi:hypothetical protein